MALRLVILERNPLVRLGYLQLLALAPDLRVEAWLRSPDELACRAVLERADLLVTELWCSPQSHFCVAEVVRRMTPTISMLGLVDDTGAVARRAMATGMVGVVSTRDDVDVILEAIRAVAAGLIYVSTRVGRALLGEPHWFPAPCGCAVGLVNGSSGSGLQVHVPSTCGAPFTSAGSRAESVHIPRRTSDEEPIPRVENLVRDRSRRLSLGHAVSGSSSGS